MDTSARERFTRGYQHATEGYERQPFLPSDIGGPYDRGYDAGLAARLNLGLRGLEMRLHVLRDLGRRTFDRLDRG